MRPDVLTLLLAWVTLGHAWQLRKIETLDMPYAAIAEVLTDPTTGLLDVVVSLYPFVRNPNPTTNPTLILLLTLP